MENKTIEQLQGRAFFFYDNMIKVFIKDVQNTYYFCKIINISETHISFECFEGKYFGQTVVLPWIDVKLIEEYGVKQ